MRIKLETLVNLVPIKFVHNKSQYKVQLYGYTFLYAHFIKEGLEVKYVKLSFRSNA